MQKAKKLPVVPFLNVLKNTQSILSNPLPFHRRNFTKHGDVFKVNLGFGNSVIFTRDAGLAKHMLQKQHRKYHKSPLQSKELARYIGEGLLTSNGEKWLTQRRLIQPAFHRKKLESLMGILNKVILEELANFPVGKNIDVYPLFSNLAFNVVARALFSYKDEGSTFKRLQFITEEAQKSLIKEIRQPYKKWWFYISGQVAKTKKLTKEARHILNEIIEERRGADVAENDLLDMLLSARYDDGSGMDNEQLIDEILILFTAGHETTSNALTFTLLLLAKHQEFQDSIVKEYDEAKAKSSTLLDVLKNMTFTQRCIEESMRLYPPAYFSDRIAVENDEYEGMHIKKGTTILISFYEIHRHTSFWKEPLAYNPDRFLEENKTFSDHYFPFGAGPRLCIGNNFAMYEMILTVAELIKRFKITSSIEEIEIKPMITLKPNNSIIKLTARSL